MRWSFIGDEDLTGLVLNAKTVNVNTEEIHGEGIKL
jgi:hypothetical protein